MTTLSRIQWSKEAEVITSKKCSIRDPDHGDEQRKKLLMVPLLGCPLRKKATAIRLITVVNPDMCRYCNINLVTTQPTAQEVLVVEGQETRLICIMELIKIKETMVTTSLSMCESSSKVL